LRIQKLLPAGTIMCLALLSPVLLRAQGCTNASYYGTYMVELQGTMLDAAGTSYQGYASLGKEVSDGNGHVTGTYNYTLNGGTSKGTYTGTYTVTSECVVTETLNVTPTAANVYTENSTFQLAAGGVTTVGGTTTTGIILAGQAYRAAAQGASQCSNGSLAGTYDFVEFGVASLLSPLVKTGQFNLDGAGHVTFSGSKNQEGSASSAISGNGTYTVNTDCTGNMAFSLNGGGTDTHYFGVEDGGSLLLLEPDAAQVTFGVAQPEATESIMGQFVFGSGYSTYLYFNNAGPAAATFTVNFIADNGTPLTVPALNGSSTLVQVPAFGTAVVEAPNNGSILNQGYATFALPPGVSGYGVFRLQVTGISEGTSQYGPSLATSATLVFDETGTLVDGIAIANPTANSETVTITATGNNGTVLGNGTITLGAHAHTAAALDTIATGLSGVKGNSGQVTFSVTSGAVSVLGLRFNAGAFTSIPAQY